jgi:FkbH-like protein
VNNNALRIISDFNAEPLGRYLRNAADLGIGPIEVASYGQVYSALAEANQSNQWAVFLWTQPQGAIPGFYSAFNLQEVDHEKLLLEVDRYSDAILALSETQYVFVATWVLPPSFPGYGMLDWKSGLGIRNLLARMNLRLAEQLQRASNVFLLDAAYWFHKVPQPESPKLWFTTKVPFVLEVMENAVADLASAIRAVKGYSRRLILLDLDNTIWGGVVGETGWQGIRLGGHDHIGEAYKDFQRELKAMATRGIQLAIVSKNNEATALEAIDNHPEMLLRRSDFAGWKINWGDKAENIALLSRELGLGVESMVFIDDNPVERDRVATAFKQLIVPEWSSDPTKSVQSLRALRHFNVATLSAEDRRRGESYVGNRSRLEFQRESGSRSDWLERLKTVVRVDVVSGSNIPRVSQLFNKTNQLNLSTRRLPEREILEWANAKNHHMLAFSVSDRFGDLGLVGIVGLELVGDRGKISDFILSCRAMGRNVEETLLHVAVAKLSEIGASSIEIVYLPTERNRPTLDVLRNANLTEIVPWRFTIDAINSVPKPTSIQLVLGND